MNIQSGKFGKFRFCPQQNVCGQKTISIINVPIIQCSSTDGPDIFQRSNDPIVMEMRILEAQQGPLFSMPSKIFPDCERPFDPDLDDPIFDDGSDWRPY